MLPTHLFLTLLVTVSAAPHAHNQRQNRIKRRSTPLLHDDVLALYNAAYATSTTATAAAETASIAVSGHGPYAAGELHGGNSNLLKAVIDVADASSTLTADAASATATGIASSDWTIAAAPRNTSMYTNTYNTDSDTDDAANEDDDDETSDDDFPDDETTTTSAAQANMEATPTTLSHHVPAWAIALTTILLTFSLAGACVFAYLRFWRTRSTSDEKPASKDNSDDALSNYKAFWELKRQSAGSFTSADASPAALASEAGTIGLGLRPVSMTSDVTLPTYQEHKSLSSNSAPATPMNEQAPPRGFLYQ